MHTTRRRSGAYRRRGILLDLREHRVATRRVQTGWTRRGIDPGVALLIGLAVGLVAAWLLLLLLVTVGW